MARLLSEIHVVCLPHGVDLPKEDRAATAPAFLAEFPQLREKRVLLFLSRVTAKKRPELIVEAAALLRRSHPDLAVLMVGPEDGHLAIVREAVRRHALEDAVVYAGYLEGVQREGAYAVSDLFVLPSVDENFALVVTEAMARALPVVLTPGVASHVYVDQSGGGVTVEGQAATIAAGIRQVLDNDPQAFGQRGRRFVAEHLTWPKVMLSGEAIYRQLIDEHSRPLSRAA